MLPTLPLLVAGLLGACTVPSTGKPTPPGPRDGGGDAPGGDTGAPDTGGDTGPTDTGSADSGGDDTGPPPDPVVTVETIGDQPSDVAAAWFTVDAVHQVDIRIDDDAVEALYAAPYTYVRGSATLDGQDMPDVGVRLRGRIGSFRELSGKPKLRIDFNQFVEDQRFLGLESVTLNNAIVDCSYLREPVAYTVFRGIGLPASRTSFARVTVNGADYGLYVVVESPDDRFLRRHFDAPDGNLYDGKYRWWADGSYTLLDFVDGVDHLYELEEGEDVGHEDIHAITTVAASRWGTQDFDEALDPLVHWESLHLLLAGEQWTGHVDGYAINTNNYWVYFDPADGRAWLLPWDLDYGFLTAATWGRSWASPAGILASGCWRDSSCAAAQAETMAEVLAVVDDLDLPGLVTQLDAAVTDEIASDPRRECSDATVASYQSSLDAWVRTRSDTLAGWWGVE